MGLEVLGYILLGLWIIGILIALTGLAMVLLWGPVLRLLRRLLRGGTQAVTARPGLAITLLMWAGRGFGVACIAVGITLAYVLNPTIGPAWDATEPRFDMPPGNDPVRNAVVEAVKPMASNGEVMGLAVGVIDGDTQAVYGFGRKSTRDAAPPDGDTVYEIGSITKVFTSLLLASLVEEGKLRLDEPLQEVLGNDIKVPTFEGTPIRLVDLSTHSAGLPRVADDFDTPRTYWATLTPGNPYADYTAPRLRTSLQLCRLTSKPGTRYEYSNFGASVLGNALCQATGLSYPELIRARITDPLEMKNTAVILTPEQSRLRVPGYAALIDVGSRRLSFAASDWDFPPGTEGVGALKSTVNDLLLFLAANIEPPQTALGRAIEEAQRPLRGTDEPDLRIGLGWHILQGASTPDPVVWHNGGTRGCSSFMAFCRNRRTAVVLLSNSFETIGQLDAAGLQILSTLHKPS